MATLGPKCILYIATWTFWASNGVQSRKPYSNAAALVGVATAHNRICVQHPDHSPRLGFQSKGKVETCKSDHAALPYAGAWNHRSAASVFCACQVRRSIVVKLQLPAVLLQEWLDTPARKNIETNLTPLFKRAILFDVPSSFKGRHR